MLSPAAEPEAAGAEPMPVRIFKTMARQITPLLVGALLFAQLVLAAHACAMPGAVWRTGQSSVAAAQIAADAAALAECMGHCQTAQQHADDKPVPLPTLAWAPGVPTMLAWARVEATVAPAHRRAATWRAADPPHTILHCCWRI